MRTPALASLALLLPLVAHAYPSSGRVAVIVDGAERPTYSGNGATYIEALRGRNYTLRISNPTSHRVAVALSVDGLNTIDARHTDPWSASKWVLEPYESVDIEGWQVSDSTARKFVFTGERSSYGAKLGQTQNLGVIEAVFYRQRTRRVQQFDEEHSSRSQEQPSTSASAPKLSDDYAATGMGGRTRHDVREVDIELDSQPMSSMRIRYEFRPQLVKLGILVDADPSPLKRREKARGFAYCPEPD